MATRSRSITGRGLLAVLLLAFSGGLEAQEVRALWVTRWDYRSEADVRSLIERAASLGVGRVLFQVRGNASVFYPSALEPWAAELGSADPGFDPLAVALEEAQRRGLALEAWINVMPLWRGTKPPADSNHAYLLHPEWRVVSESGKPQQRNEHYVCGNPVRQDFRAHVAGIAAEIATNYAVDAVHLDYIRYVLDLEGEDFSWDAQSLALFGGDPKEQPEGWLCFKAEQVTGMVAEIRAAVRAARPACRLTAAVFAPAAARVKVGQDVESWVRQGLVDALYPMCYAETEQDYAQRLAESLPLGGDSVPVIVGIAAGRHADPAQTFLQIETARAQGAAGVALFSYSAFFPSPDQGALGQAPEPSRDARAGALRRFFGEP